MGETYWSPIVRRYAEQAGHPDPDQFVRQIKQESGFREDVITCAFINSAGVRGIAQIHPKFHTVDACDPHKALPYAAALMTNKIKEVGPVKALIDYNWGIGNRQNNWNGTWEDLPEETQHYLAVIMGEEQARREMGEVVTTGKRIGPDIPAQVVNQLWDWDCSVSTTYAALWLRHRMGGGMHPSYNELVEAMQNANVVGSDVGLKDGSGRGLAKFLGSKYGIEAYNVSPLERGRVIEEITRGNVVAIGGHQWGVAGHWALAVGYEADGSIIIENPAPGYKLGATPINDFIRDSWAKSSWSGVVIPVGAAVGPVDPPPVVKPCEEVVRIMEGQISELHRQIAELQTKLGEAANYDGSVRQGLEALIVYLETLATKKDDR